MAISTGTFSSGLSPYQCSQVYPLREAADALYQQLLDAGFDILFDDRGQRPGVAFADMDLIGISSQTYTW